MWLSESWRLQPSPIRMKRKGLWELFHGACLTAVLFFFLYLDKVRFSIFLELHSVKGDSAQKVILQKGKGIQ